ncbi:MAG: ATP-binding protein [Casimicrobiaceae bacterium]
MPSPANDRMKSDAGLLVLEATGSALVLRIHNSIGALAPAHQAIHDFLVAAGTSDKAVFDAELVFEELFTNSVRYGYEKGESRTIDARIELSGGEIVMSFDDDAAEFDSTKSVDPVLPRSIEEAQIGGLGLMLVRKLAKSMEYRRHNGRNSLRVALART